MFNVNIIVDTSALDRLTERFQQAPQTLATLIDAEVVVASQARVDEEMNVGGVHKRPTEWQSARQRRWWFAVGILQWHGRKAKQDWITLHRPAAQRGEIVVINPMPWAKFVWTPPFQQRMHIGTWTSSSTFAALEVPALAIGIGDAWRKAHQ